MSLEREVNNGKVLYQSEALKPDHSVLPKTNVIGKRPLERLGTSGSYTPGVKTLQGGKARDVPLEREVNHGTVLYVSDTLKPDVSGLPQTNIVGGRPDERRSSKGSFTEGLRSWAGGLPRDVPLECTEPSCTPRSASSQTCPSRARPTTSAAAPKRGTGARGPSVRGGGVQRAEPSATLPPTSTPAGRRMARRSTRTGASRPRTSWSGSLSSPVAVHPPDCGGRGAHKNPSLYGTTSPSWTYSTVVAFC